MSGAVPSGEGQSSSSGPAPRVPFTSYQRKLFLFLSVACFFEGYDFIALTQILPNLRADFGLSERHGTWLIAFINFGTILAYLLGRKADRWGRRRVLNVTIAGYTILSGLSGLAPNAVVFGILQMLARIFLIGEWATSMVIAAEEFPAARRGTVIGVISAATGLGSVVCAGVVPLLLKSPYGWRTVYFVGVIPLLILAYSRRNLRETERFQAKAKETASAPQALGYILKGPYRRRVLELGAIWLLTYVCTQNATTFWKEFALKERSLTDGEAGLAIVIAAVGAMPLAFFAGKLIDVIGRKAGAAVIYGATIIGVFGAYTLHDRWSLTASLLMCIAGVNCVLTVMNSFTTELFPTELRADAFAWSNNLIGRIGYVLSPIAIGEFVGDSGWGGTLRATVLFPLVALILIFVLLPETKAKELEETAAV